jgi:hypothetical protein
MAESGWPASVIMREHLQNLMSLGYMTAAESTTYRVPKDLASPILVGGYIMVCVMFYE